MRKKKIQISKLFNYNDCEPSLLYEFMSEAQSCSNKLVENDFYKTKQFVCIPFYKSISGLIKSKKNER